MSGLITGPLIELFGQSRHAWFQQFLALPNGIPSHDTFNREFALWDARQFETAFRQWVQTVYSLIPREGVAIDGKTVHRAHNRKKGQSPLHLVSA